MKTKTTRFLAMMVVVMMLMGTLSFSANAASGYDLMVSDVKTETALVYDNTPFKLVATVRNLGDTNFTGSVDVEFRINSVLVEATKFTGTIEADSFVRVTTSGAFDVMFGLHTIKSTVDPKQTTQDLNFANNALSKKITVLEH